MSEIAPDAWQKEMEDARAALRKRFPDLRCLERLEPKITEILLTGAKQTDIQKLQVELAEARGRVSMLPTWWMLIVAIVATWSVGAGIVFALVRAAHP
jgi:hypothetical protein